MMNQYTRDEILYGCHSADDHLPAWRSQNNQGLGFEVGRAEQTPEEAAREGGMEIMGYGDEGKVLAIDGEDLLVICDAHGPWACRVGVVVEEEIEEDDEEVSDEPS